VFFEKIIDQISINPFQFPIFSKKKNLRRCVINEQTTLYYRISNNIVELVSFRGNLMNPNTVNL